MNFSKNKLVTSTKLDGSLLCIEPVDHIVPKVVYGAFFRLKHVATNRCVSLTKPIGKTKETSKLLKLSPWYYKAELTETRSYREVFCCKKVPSVQVQDLAALASNIVVLAGFLQRLKSEEYRNSHTEISRKETQPLIEACSDLIYFINESSV